VRLLLRNGSHARLFVGLVLTVGLIGLTSALAFRSHDEVIPSLLVDPYGDFSTVHLPEWGTNLLPLTVGDRVVGIEGEPLVASRPVRRADALERELAARYRRGERSVVLDFEGPSGTKSVRLPLRRLGSRAIAAFYGVYAGMGALLLWSGFYVSRVAGRRAAARAYLAMSVVSFVFLATFLDYHTTRVLVPLWAASSGGLVVSLFFLAYSFPEPFSLGRFGESVVRSLLTIAVGASLALALAPLLGFDPRPLRQTVNVGVPVSLVSLALAMLFRLRRASGRPRRELVTASAGLLVVPAVVAIAFVTNNHTANGYFHIALPLVGFFVPASVGRSFMRHNVLAAGDVVSRQAMAVPAVLLGIVAGSVVALLMGVFEGQAATLTSPAAAASGLGVGCLVLVVSRAAVDRWMFPATNAFRPVVRDLAGRLAIETRRAGVESVLVSAATRWLPSVRIRAVSAAAAYAAMPDDEEPKLLAGDAVWTESDTFLRDLVVPMVTDGRLHGALVLAPKRGGAPYTAEDVALLQTMAHLGGLALRHLEAMEMLEELRRVEVTASRGEGRVAMDVLGAELAHELAYPLAFFRHMLSRLGPGNRLDDEDIEIGRDEVARMERMLASVRRLQMPPAHCVAINLRAVVDKAVSLLRADIEAKQLFVQLDVDPARSVDADPDQLLQLLANLIRNAVQAAPNGGRVAVVSHAHDEIVFEVRDDGSGLPDAIANRLFTPFTTTRPEGTGLGLAVAKRIAASFEWDIEAVRVDGFTVFRVRREARFQATTGERVA